jgi:ribonuclease VapC
MIVVDASAILAILRQEPDCEVYSDQIAGSDRAEISMSSVLECSMRVQVEFGVYGEARLDALLDETGIATIAIDEVQLAVARSAFGRYGKGIGHPARLNFGDCFSYALAKTRNLPLLFKGNDFIHTDIPSALQAPEQAAP